MLNKSVIRKETKQNDLKQSYNHILVRLLFFIIPSIVYTLTAVFFLDLNFYKIRTSVAEVGTFSLILFLLIDMVPGARLRKYLFFGSYLLLVFKVFFQASYYNLYGENISASTIFIIVETNLAETREFLGAYLEPSNIFLLVLLMGPLLLYKNINFGKSNGNVISLHTGFIFLFLASTSLYHLKDLKRFDLFYVAWNSYKEYKDQSLLYSELDLHLPYGKFKQVTIEKSSDRKIFVVVIGESTTRHRMGIYGYPRQTTPRLSELQDELVVFKDVISPHTHTIPSLAKIMTLNHYEDPNRLQEGTLIQLMNRTGFNTSWISNQRPVGLHENLITKIAKASDNLHFLNVRNYNIESLYDEVILEPLDKVLQNEDDIFVVIHLLGTHAGYANRYPPNYNKFKGVPPLVNDYKKGKKTVNEYDNAVLYNDHVLAEIIEKVRGEEAYSYVLYFSDHGEDVYQVMEKASHTETNGTYPMYDVPFILWQSEKFRKENDLVFKPEREYMLDDLIYSVSDLSGIRFKNYEPERSIFNKSFLARKRIIYNETEYDSIFKR